MHQQHYVRVDGNHGSFGIKEMMPRRDATKANHQS